MQTTLRNLLARPERGRRRFAQDPDLKSLRSCLVVKPFQKQLLFYRVEGESLVVERTMHGARNLHRRLKEPPQAND